jgi:hypothetical protein
MDQNNSTVVLLGAGFSKEATDGHMPTMASWFDQLNFNQYPRLYRFVCSIKCCNKHANLESVLLALDQIKSSPINALEGWADEWLLHSSEIYKELENYTFFRIKNSLTFRWENWAVQWLRHFNPEATIVSMNYDNIAERIVVHRSDFAHDENDPLDFLGESEYGSAVRCPCPYCKMKRVLRQGCSSCNGDNDMGDLWRGSIIKPNGSISWKRCSSAVCCESLCLSLTDHGEPFDNCKCHRCSACCCRAIALPSMPKNLAEIPEIGVMWKVARQAIGEAKHIVLFGFSMPQSDELLTLMLRNAIHSNRKLRQLEIYDVNPFPVYERFRKCIPKGIDVDVTFYQVWPGRGPVKWNPCPYPPGLIVHAGGVSHWLPQIMKRPKAAVSK